MFAADCPVLDRTVLVWPSQMLGIHNGPAGIDVSYRCHCGGEAVWRTGRAVARPHLVAHRDAVPPTVAAAAGAHGLIPSSGA